MGGGAIEDVGCGGKKSYRVIQTQRTQCTVYEGNDLWLEGVEYALPQPPKKSGGLVLKIFLVINGYGQTIQVLGQSQLRELD